MLRRPPRRSCAEPRARARRCRPGSKLGVADPPLLQARRARSACRMRADFTGRGFGSVRLREAR